MSSSSDASRTKQVAETGSEQATASPVSVPDIEKEPEDDDTAEEMMTEPSGPETTINLGPQASSPMSTPDQSAVLPGTTCTIVVSEETVTTSKRCSGPRGGGVSHDECEQRGQDILQSTHPGAKQSDGSFLSPAAVLNAIHDNVQTNLSEVPQGVKENVYFVINNEDNVSRQLDNKRALYIDDCGAWGSSSKKTHRYVLKGDQLQYLDFKDGLYCNVLKKKRVALDPQPQHEEVIIFKRYYCSLKCDKNFRRRISTVHNCPEGLQELKNLAVVEYIGKFPDTIKAHGNSKKSETEYIRTVSRSMRKLDAITNTQMPEQHGQDIQSTLPGSKQSDGSFLGPQAVLNAIRDDAQTNLSEVPQGVKENVYFVLNNEDNVSRKLDNKKALYIDDCGAWGSSSMKTHHYTFKDNQLQYLDFKDGSYCNIVKKQRVVLDPQPQHGEVIIFKRYYCSLKCDNNFRRRISTVHNCPEDLRELKDLAVVEYIGKYPDTMKVHGNSKKSETKYVRTVSSSKRKLKVITETQMPDEQQSYNIQSTLPGAKQSNGSFLSPEAVLNAIHNNAQTNFTEVPQGVKENVYFVLNNEDNVSRKLDNKKALYIDDCGAWGSSSMKTHRYVLKGDQLQYLDFKDGLYCNVLKKKRVALDTQPQHEEVIIFKRYYCSLKCDKNFRKRISTVHNCPRDLQALKNLAVVEYIGKFPDTIRVHGNSKKSETEYIRTVSGLKRKLEAITETQMPRDVYQDLLLDGSHDAPRDLKQVQNAKFQKTKGSRRAKHRKNAAEDEMQTLLDHLQEHEFMQEIIHTEGQNPSVILYLDDNIRDIKQFCSSESPHPCVLGVDRTFNLGTCHVTTLLYHHRNLVRKSTDNHPIMLAAVFLHWDDSYQTYHRVFSHLQSKLDMSVGATQVTNVVIGSEEEVALTEAIKACFPTAHQVLSSKHLEEDTRRHLTDDIGVDGKIRRIILKEVFGSGGLIQCTSIADFELYAAQLQLKYSEMLPAFVTYFAYVTEKMHASITDPKQHDKWLPIDRKNKSCESMNIILKLSTDWKLLKLPDLVDKFYKIVKVQQQDMRRALYGYGNYKLAPWVRKVYVSHAVWMRKTEDQKDQLYQEFMEGVSDET